MSYLLDTNVCIKYLNGQSITIRHRLESAVPSDILLSSVVKAELFYGAAKSRQRQENLSKLALFFSAFEPVPFDDAAALEYGRIRAELELLGAPIGPNDLLIAATALSRKATLVTANTREFTRVTGLLWENWDEGPMNSL